MHLTLIINSIVCLVGAIAGLLFALASIISIANMTVRWSAALVVAALLIPVAFVVSGIGVWLVSSTPVTIGLISLPWAYGLVFVICMLVSFKFQQ
jgi:hypothetical protein